MLLLQAKSIVRLWNASIIKIVTVMRARSAWKEAMRVSVKRQNVLRFDAAVLRVYIRCKQNKKEGKQFLLPFFTVDAFLQNGYNYFICDERRLDNIDE